MSPLTPLSCVTMFLCCIDRPSYSWTFATLPMVLPACVILGAPALTVLFVSLSFFFSFFFLACVSNTVSATKYLYMHDLHLLARITVRKNKNDVDVGRN